MSTAYLNSVNCFLDQKCLVDNLDFFGNDQVQKEKYKAGGMQFHYKTDKSLSEMAHHLLFNFLNENPTAKDFIDVVIFTTDNMDKSGDINVVSTNMILKKLNLQNAFPIFQSFSNCANITSSFMTACSMVESGRANNVLVVSVDKMQPDDIHYQMNPEMSVLSDAGVCLWVSSNPSGIAYMVEGIFQKNNPEQWIIDRKANFQQYSVNKLRLFAFLSKQIKSKITSGQKNYYILNNYFRHVIDMFIGVLGISADEVNFDNISQVGHAPAGDVFINFIDLINNKEIAEDANFILVADSPSLCSAVILRKIN